MGIKTVAPPAAATRVPREASCCAFRAQSAGRLAARGGGDITVCRRLERDSFFLRELQSLPYGLRLIRRGSPTGQREICFTQSLLISTLITPKNPSTDNIQTGVLTKAWAPQPGQVDTSNPPSHAVNRQHRRPAINQRTRAPRTRHKHRRNHPFVWRGAG